MGWYAQNQWRVQKYARKLNARSWDMAQAELKEGEMIVAYRRKFEGIGFAVVALLPSEIEYDVQRQCYLDGAELIFELYAITKEQWLAYDGDPNAPWRDQ